MLVNAVTCGKVAGFSFLDENNPLNVRSCSYFSVEHFKTKTKRNFKVF